MEIFIITVVLILAVVGVLGAVIPMLPGPPLSFLALLLLWCFTDMDVSTTSLWVTGIMMVVVTVLDYVAPIWLTNVGGGSKYGTNGATVGMVLGLFFMPWGLVIGPFLGAFVGELIAHATTGKAMKVAMMSFVAFVVTTGVKLIYSVVLFAMILKELIGKLF